MIEQKRSVQIKLQVKQINKEGIETKVGINFILLSDHEEKSGKERIIWRFEKQ